MTCADRATVYFSSSPTVQAASSACAGRALSRGATPPKARGLAPGSIPCSGRRPDPFPEPALPAAGRRRCFAPADGWDVLVAYNASGGKSCPPSSGPAAMAPTRARFLAGDCPDHPMTHRARSSPPPWSGPYSQRISRKPLPSGTGYGRVSKDRRHEGVRSGDAARRAGAPSRI